MGPTKRGSRTYSIAYNARKRTATSRAQLCLVVFEGCFVHPVRLPLAMLYNTLWHKRRALWRGCLRARRVAVRCALCEHQQAAHGQRQGYAAEGRPHAIAADPINHGLIDEAREELAE
jgi:hypothetical protein